MNEGKKIVQPWLAAKMILAVTTVLGSHKYS